MTNDKLIEANKHNEIQVLALDLNRYKFKLKLLITKPKFIKSCKKETQISKQSLDKTLRLIVSHLKAVIGPIWIKCSKI